MVVFGILMGCQCLEKAPPEDLKPPKEYVSFILEGYKDFWDVLDDSEKKGIDVDRWVSFEAMQLNFEENDVDIKTEFVTRMLINDKSWVNYSDARKAYLKFNPGKTFYDQIAEIIKDNWTTAKE